MQSSVVAGRRSVPGQIRMLAGIRTRSLFDSLFPNASIWHRIFAAIVMAAVTAGLAQARFYLPDNPVPITFQTTGVLLTGGLLGFRWGLASAVLYYIVGMAGVPVFQGANSGWSYIAHGITGGYLLGFILATTVTGYFSERGWNRGRALWPMTISALLVYGPGLAWLAVFDLGWPAEGQLFSAGMYPFIPGDIVKLLIAALGVGLLWRLVDSRSKPHSADIANTER